MLGGQSALISGSPVARISKSELAANFGGKVPKLTDSRLANSPDEWGHNVCARSPSAVWGHNPQAMLELSKVAVQTFLPSSSSSWRILRAETKHSG